MKKIFSGFMMAAAALFVTSCASDELTSSQTGGEATVSFSLALEDGIGTRAISDGSGADVLEYAVFNENGERVSGIQKVKRTGVTFPTVENITLAKGQTYKIAFWAQDEDCKAYTVSDDMNVSIDYTGVNNDETRDAFFKSIEFTVSGSASLDVVLKRPFAQINVGVYQEDWDAAVASGIEIANSVAYIKNAATSINLLNGMVGEETTDVPVEYTAAAIPTESLMVDVDKDGTKEAYKWLSMSYILVADHGTTPDNDGIYGAAATTLNDLGFSFVPVSGNAITFAQGLKSVPVERNWRTNIIGKILTGDVEFNISIDPIYDGDYIYPDGLVQEIIMAAAIGGTVTLTDNVTMPEGGLNVQGSMILNLNGFNLSCPDDDILFRVQDGATLVVNGEGKVDTGLYFASANQGGTIIVNGGEFNCGTTCLQANGGKVYVKGGTFDVKEADKTYMLNHIDSKKNDGLIEVSGGKFNGFDPANSNSENPAMNFLKEGYKSVSEGDWFVVRDGTDIKLYGDYAEVYSADGLLKWAYLVNNGNKTLGLKLMNDVTLSAYTIEADAANETYVYTSTPITVTDGVPSGANWVSVCTGILSLSDAYSGHIDGQGNTISGLRISHANDQVGFVGAMYDDASIKNLTIADAVVCGQVETGVVVGRSHNGTTVENVLVKASTVTGTYSVGGVAGFNYRRIKTGINESISYIKNCTTDKNTKVFGTGTVGGICGTNNGAVVIDCVNSADVTGDGTVGGVVGMSREYNTNVNGYLIACGSTSDATITATTSNAGGVTGNTINDPNHSNAEGFVVACYSTSAIVGNNSGVVLGYSNHSVLRASWGAQNGSNIITGSFTPTMYSVYKFADASAVTQADVDAMNQAIADYNAISGIEQTCPYTWSWTNGSWPVLK